MSDTGSRAGSAEPTQNPAEDEHDHQIQEDRAGGDHADDGPADDSDKDSEVLSEIDEDQFQNFEEDEEDDGPKEIDEDAIKALRPANRKVVDSSEAANKRKAIDKRRSKKRARLEDDADQDAADSGDTERRPRKARATKEAKAARKRTPESDNEENLTPEERRKRALDRVMENAVRGSKVRRRKKDEIDLEEEADEQIASLKVRMETACLADNQARNDGKPALQKLALLPEVTAMLNRTAIQDSVLDPETNFLQSVKYFLEPLDDGSLPAYNIQYDIFTSLTKLPINKEMLLSSELGKVVLFYTKSRRAEAVIKRMAERLVGEWSRPILKRTDDYKKRHVEMRNFDYTGAKLQQRQEAAGSSQFTLSQRPAAKSRYEQERERLLAPDIKSNRARPAGLPQTYTIAPKSNFNPSQAPDHRPIGAAGAEAFRKMTQKGKGGRH